MTGGAAGLFLATLVVGNFFLPADKAITRKSLGHDFLAFYSAGTFARTGRLHDLYNLDSARELQHRIAAENGLEIGQSFGPYWNPPFYAWVFAPLSALPYRTALNIWLGINVGALTLAIALLCHMLVGRPRARLSREEAYELRLCREDQPASSWRAWLLVPLLLVISSPFLQAISHAQNTFTSLLLLSAAVTAWRSHRAFLAGLTMGLLFYKPQLAAVVALAMVFDLGWRAVAGLAVTGAALLAVTLTTMPGAIDIYRHALPLNLHFMQVEHTYLWERHVTLKAFWRLLLQGREAGEATTAVTIISLASAGAVVFGLAAAFARSRHIDARDAVAMARRRDRFIAATIAAMPLLMPFYFDYDLLLLSIPVVLLARDIRQAAHDNRRATPLLGPARWAVWALVGLCAVLYFSPHMATYCRVNLTVILLWAVSTLLTVRLGQRGPSIVDTANRQPKTPLRHAA